MIVLVVHYRQKIEELPDLSLSCCSVASCKGENLIDGHDLDEGQCLDSGSLNIEISA